MSGKVFAAAILRFSFKTQCEIPTLGYLFGCHNWTSEIILQGIEDQPWYNSNLKNHAILTFNWEANKSVFEDETLLKVL